MKYKLIIFDFDGTLGDTRKNIVTTMQLTIAELQLQQRSERQCAATIGLPLTGCFKALFPDLPPELIQRCADTYRSIFDEKLRDIIPQAFPGVVETLTALGKQGVTLTIASSRSNASLVRLTRDMGISDVIFLTLGSDDVERAKPHPEAVLKTLDTTHFKADEALVVGDMAVDILMGANAGTRTCGVTWGNGSREELLQAGADFIIDKMEDLLLCNTLLP